MYEARRGRQKLAVSRKRHETFPEAGGARYMPGFHKMPMVRMAERPDKNRDTYGSRRRARRNARPP